jgi:hypothetical protein
MADKDRTIRLQQNAIEKLEKEKGKSSSSDSQSSSSESKTETVNSATQTERVSLKLKLEFKLFLIQIYLLFSSCDQSQWVRNAYQGDLKTQTYVKLFEKLTFSSSFKNIEKKVI